MDRGDPLRKASFESKERGFAPSGRRFNSRRGSGIAQNDKGHPKVAFVFAWWTRRELNPRPKAISGQDYMLISLIWSRRRHEREPPCRQPVR